MNVRAISFFLMSTIVCLVAPQSLHAVSPAPDGAYSGDNTAEGAGALSSLTTGVFNTALGTAALFHDTSGSANTATGVQALLKNNAGIRNTADGAGALLQNNGSFNTATGWSALFNNTNGVANTADGAQALNFNTIGNHNTADGAGALLHNNGNNNTAVGWSALFNNTTGSGNVAVGLGALQTNTIAGEASANGANVAVGFDALLSATGATADGNTGVGDKALVSNTTGNTNTALGTEALKDVTTGVGNTGCGWLALENAGGASSNNTAIGMTAGDNVFTASGVTCLGVGAIGDDVNNSTWIANVSGVTTKSGTTLPVLVSSTGQLGTAASSARFKKDIKSMQDTSDAILQLRPVTFHYKADTEAVPQFGLVAEEVEKVDPDLVVKDKDGKVFTVRYDAVNVMLLNEFLKEHRKVQEQQTTIAELKKDIGALVARTKEQDRKIQKVSDQVELNKPAPRVIASQR